jgi:Protein of unknown function (DUF2442)
MMQPAVITDVRVDDRAITFVLSDGRELSVPTTWSRRLSSAKADDRAKWEIGGTGTYVEWPTIDEHIGVWTMLGVPEDEVLEAAGFEMERVRAL